MGITQSRLRKQVVRLAHPTIPCGIVFSTIAVTAAQGPDLKAERVAEAEFSQRRILYFDPRGQEDGQRRTGARSLAPVQDQTGTGARSECHPKDRTGRGSGPSRRSLMRGKPKAPGEVRSRRPQTEDLGRGAASPRPCDAPRGRLNGRAEPWPRGAAGRYERLHILCQQPRRPNTWEGPRGNRTNPSARIPKTVPVTRRPTILICPARRAPHFERVEVFLCGEGFFGPKSRYEAVTPHVS